MDYFFRAFWETLKGLLGITLPIALFLFGFYAVIRAMVTLLSGL